MIVLLRTGLTSLVFSSAIFNPNMHWSNFMHCTPSMATTFLTSANSQEVAPAGCSYTKYRFDQACNAQSLMHHLTWSFASSSSLVTIFGPLRSRLMRRKCNAHRAEDETIRLSRLYEINNFASCLAVREVPRLP